MTEFTFKSDPRVQEANDCWTYHPNEEEHPAESLRNAVAVARDSGQNVMLGWDPDSLFGYQRIEPTQTLEAATAQFHRTFFPLTLPKDRVYRSAESHKLIYIPNSGATIYVAAVNVVQGSREAQESVMLHFSGKTYEVCPEMTPEEVVEKVMSKDTPQKPWTESIKKSTEVGTGRSSRG